MKSKIDYSVELIPNDFYKHIFHIIYPTTTNSSTEDTSGRDLHNDDDRENFTISINHILKYELTENNPLHNSIKNLLQHFQDFEANKENLLALKALAEFLKRSIKKLETNLWNKK